MTCETALDRMMEAEPAELRGPGDTPLARHLQTCPRCGRVAAALVAELDALDAALDAYAAAGDAEAAADTALAAAPPRPAGREAPSPRSPWWRRSLRGGVPLAAAAAVATLLLVGRGPDPEPSPAPAPVTSRSPRVAVEPPANRGAAVLETGNPNITIVWLYEREDR